MRGAHELGTTRRLTGLAATEALGAGIAAGLRPGDAVLLAGPLGAGKSALARALIRAALGDPGQEVPSPSFSLVQSYPAPGFVLHHYDLWRLAGPEGVAELGWDEARSGVVVVEWPDRLGALRPEEALSVTLAITGEGSRAAHLAGWPGRLGALTLPP